MKTIKMAFMTLCLAGLIVGCQTPTSEGPDPGWEAYERNSETVLKFLQDWVNESPDYSIYAEDYESTSTGYEREEMTENLSEMMESNKGMFSMYDFEITIDSINLLPGVDPVTKKMDGSVRWYGQWKLTKSATDSTEAKSANLMIYHAWVFNEEGKITTSMAFGDFGIMMQDLWEEEEDESEEAMEE